MEKLAPGTVKSHSPAVGGFEPDWESSELSHAVSCGRVESGSQVELDSQQSQSQVLLGHWKRSYSLRSHHHHHSERKRKPKSMVLRLMSYISAASTSCQSTLARFTQTATWTFKTLILRRF